MKTVLYISYVNLGKTGTIGIMKKVHAQMDALQKEGFLVYYAYIERDRLISNYAGLSSEHLDAGHIGRSLNRILLKQDFSQIDCVYIRYKAFSMEFLSLLKMMHQNHIRVMVEIPTYPFVGEFWQKALDGIKKRNISSFVRYMLLLMTYPVFSRLSGRYIDRIVTYSEDRKIWGVETLQISNGVPVVENDCLTYQPRCSNEIVMMCVSSCLNWHGYDRAIEGLRIYYEKNRDIRVLLHIVGDGPELNHYKAMTSEYGLEPYVNFCGNLYGAELDEVYRNSHVALDAMGRHRVGVYYNSSIKGKEYALKGLPIVSGVRTEFDRDKNFDFYMRVPADDTPLIIDDVVAFVLRVEKKDGYHSVIQQYARTHFRMENVMKPVMDYICIQ